MTPKASHSPDLPVVEEGDIDAEVAKAEAVDTPQPLAPPASNSGKSIEAKRSESMMIGRVRGS